MYKIKFQYRNKFGRKEIKKNRYLKIVPAVIYGFKKYNIHISIKETHLMNLNSAPENILLICNNNKNIFYIVQIKEIQYHPYKNKILHIDFFYKKNLISTLLYCCATLIIK